MKTKLYNQSHVPLARNLRVNQTNAEKLLWRKIRSRQINNRKFRRQVPVGRYILDFYCTEIQLGIELDGGQHDEDADRDRERTRHLNKKGIRVVRFWNNVVLKDLETVLNEIWRITKD